MEINKFVMDNESNNLGEKGLKDDRLLVFTYD